MTSRQQILLSSRRQIPPSPVYSLQEREIHDWPRAAFHIKERSWCLSA
jgi:hypothetical protein